MRGTKRNNPILGCTRRMMALLLILFLMLPNLLPVYATDTTVADVQVALPAGADSYSVTFQLAHNTEWNPNTIVPAEESFMVTWMQGGVVQHSSLLFTANYNTGYVATLTDVDAGTDITVHDVFIGGTMGWATMVSTKITVMAQNTSGITALLADNPRTVLATDVVADTPILFESGALEVKNRTTASTFENRTEAGGIDGQYDLGYFLTHYNVISLKDIESTHIVGPIIAMEGAYRTGSSYPGASTLADNLVASDYAKGISSYVGRLSSQAHNSALSAFILGYGFEITPPGSAQDYGFCPPSFYTRETELDDGDSHISVGLASGEMFQDNPLSGIDYITLHRNGSHFPSPNGSGATAWGDPGLGFPYQFAYTYQNNDFMDEDKLKAAVNTGSEKLIRDGILVGKRDIVVYDQPVTTLTLEIGGSYTIKDATKLESVNLLLPDDYDFDTNSTLPATTINFDCETINPTVIDSQLHSQFPKTLINGAEFEPTMGKDGEFGEVGNKIIWNLPYVKTTGENNRLVTVGLSANIAGHIVAPQAEFWNYKVQGSTTYWSGGNLNGTAIFASFHSGNMEMHMWPYDGLEEKSVNVPITAEKTMENGSLKNWDFTFELTLTSDNAGGIANTALPLRATNDDEGNIAFERLYFSQPEVYTFTMSEINDGIEDIIYDTTTYDVIITVTEEGGKLVATTAISKAGEDVSTAVFKNRKETTIPGYHFTFYKQNTNGDLLGGAQFTVTPQGDSSDTEKVYTSDQNGTFSVTLQPSTTYHMVETQAPEGYQKAIGYWEIVVDSSGAITITPMEGAPSLEHHIIVNERTEVPTVDVPLVKQNEFGDLLEGATFQVQEIIQSQGSDRYDTLVESGYLNSFTSDRLGKFTITGLSCGRAYRLTETQAPSGYTPPGVHWILVVDDAGDHTLLLDQGEGTDYAPITDDIVVNYSTYHLPLTGGAGTQTYSFLGLALMISACVYLQTNLISNKRRKTE